MKLNIDLKLLKQQKKRLVGLSMKGKLGNKDQDALDGIINLLDVIQDQYEDGDITSWIETHHEIVAWLHDPSFEKLYEIVTSDHGTKQAWVFAEEATNEFQTMNKGRQWDGEFYDEVCAFMEKKLAEI